jgi:hypothetical protein
LLARRVGVPRPRLTRRASEGARPIVCLRRVPRSRVGLVLENDLRRRAELTHRSLRNGPNQNPEDIIWTTVMATGVDNGCHWRLARQRDSRAAVAGFGGASRLSAAITARTGGAADSATPGRASGGAVRLRNEPNPKSEALAGINLGAIGVDEPERFSAICGLPAPAQRVFTKGISLGANGGSPACATARPRSPAWEASCPSAAITACAGGRANSATPGRAYGRAVRLRNEPNPTSEAFAGIDLGAMDVDEHERFSAICGLPAPSNGSSPRDSLWVPLAARPPVRQACDGRRPGKLRVCTQPSRPALAEQAASATPRGAWRRAVRLRNEPNPMSEASTQIELVAIGVDDHERFSAVCSTPGNLRPVPSNEPQSIESAPTPH